MSPNATDSPIIPDEIAKNVILPASYADEKKVHTAFRWIRANMPLAKASVEGYDTVWVVSKYDDLLTVERDANLFHNADISPQLFDHATEAHFKKVKEETGVTLHSVSYMDPPEHKKYRSVIAREFFPSKMGKLEPHVREVVKDAVQKFLTCGDEFDFHQDYIESYPLHIIMSLMGVPHEDWAYMLRLTHKFFGHVDEEQPDEKPDGNGSAPVRGNNWTQAVQEISAYFTALGRKRRTNPKDDLISIIANAKVDGEYVDDLRANGLYLALATAGHDTTASTASQMVMAMAQHPDQFAFIKANPDGITGLFEEAVRFGSPVKHFMRNATADTEVAGQTIRAGDRLMMCYPSANRDEEVFYDPDSFDCRRDPNRHVGFGYGTHVCLGQHLARLDLRILFEELMPHIRSIELTAEPTYQASNFVAGMRSLPIRVKRT